MCPTPYIGDGHPTFDRETLNWHISPYYGVDHPLKQWQFRPQQKGISTSMVWIFDIFCVSEWQNDFYALIPPQKPTKNRQWLALQAVPYHLLFGFFYSCHFLSFLSTFLPASVLCAPAGGPFLVVANNVPQTDERSLDARGELVSVAWSIEVLKLGASIHPSAFDRSNKAAEHLWLFLKLADV